MNNNRLKYYKFINKKYLRAFFIKYLKHNKKYQLLADFLYYVSFKKLIDWKNPKDLNQWINWLQFNSDTSLWSRLTDKFEVREFVKKKGFEKNLIPLLAVWDSPDKIDLSKLPDKFAIKMNNGSGDVLIINDKSKIKENDIKNHFESVFNCNFANSSGEKHYEKIKPLIIVEELLDKNKQCVSSSSMIDYKIWCFDGKPECIRVYYNRTKSTVNLDTYDLNWINHPEYNNYTKKFIKSDQQFPKPKKLEEMLHIATELSKGFPQVRVDLYETDDKIYFGELTFTSSTGKMKSFSENYLKFLGNKVAQEINHK